jgi:hypothetical protein
MRCQGERPAPGSETGRNPPTGVRIFLTRPGDYGLFCSYSLIKVQIRLPMGDLFGISRTIDHAVYTILNSIAIILWRLDAAIIQFSIFSYVTEDWLMGHRDGDGIWTLMDRMVGPNGIFGLSTWEAFVALALTIYGFSFG